MVQCGGGRVAQLPTNAKLRKIQQNTYGLVQLIGAARPNVRNQTPMPQPTKQLPNACSIPPLHIVVKLLVDLLTCCSLNCITMIKCARQVQEVNRSPIPPFFIGHPELTFD